jgi:hypothetical protein
MPTPFRTAVAAACAVVLALSSCTFVVQKDSASSTTGGAATPTTTAPLGDAPADADFSAAPVRGITDDTIKLGAAFIDVDKVREFGVDLGEIPTGITQAFVKAQNARGGINGRKVEVVERRFLPIGSEDSEKACRELIEDEKVFAVLGSFLDDNALCVTETYSTPYFGGFGLTSERAARSKATYITTQGSGDADLVSAVDMLLAKKTLAQAKVAVYWENDMTKAWVDSTLIAKLRAGGVDVVSTAQLPDSDDQVQANSDMTRILQRFQADGADTILSLAGLAVFLPTYEKSTYRPKVVFTNGQIIGDKALAGYGLTDPKVLDGSIGVVGGIVTDEVAADPQFQRCLDDLNTYGGYGWTLDDLRANGEGDAPNIGLVPSLCSIWDLTVQVLEAAGDDPTPESILQGLDGIEIELPAQPGAALSRTRWGAGIPMRLWDYDTAKGRFEPVGTLDAAAGE